MISIVIGKSFQNIFNYLYTELTSSFLRPAAINTFNELPFIFPDLPVQKQPIPQDVFGSLKKPHEDDND
jgi:hypothetical protein